MLDAVFPNTATSSNGNIYQAQLSHPTTKRSKEIQERGDRFEIHELQLHLERIVGRCLCCSRFRKRVRGGRRRRLVKRMTVITGGRGDGGESSSDPFQRTCLHPPSKDDFSDAREHRHQLDRLRHVFVDRRFKVVKLNLSNEFGDVPPRSLTVRHARGRW